MEAELIHPQVDVKPNALAAVFALSLFLSAALLFWVQPLIAKMLLPFLGGAASVWNTCMVFFQTSLLCGYAYALLISRKLSIRNQAVVHVLLLIVAAFVLPFSLSNLRLASLPTTGSPIPWLLLTLLLTVGPPFFVLSATAPLLQRWFSHSTHRSAHDPYFLYAISNAGSMLSLLAFPFLLEPALTIRSQNKIWAGGYALLVLSIIGSAVALRGRTKASEVGPSSRTFETVVTTKEKLNWLLLAFVPSSLMLGVTTYIATDVASVPLIWIIPLALYLLTFILAFSSKQILKLNVASYLLPITIVALGAMMILKPPVSAWFTISLHVALFFVAAFISHRRLALARPAVKHLTEYYLWIAVGGVLGGIFNAILAPLLFPTPLEFPIVIVLACFMRPESDRPTALNKWIPIAFPAFVLLLTFGLSVLALHLSVPDKLQNGIALFLPLLICYVATVRQPALFAIALAAFLLGAKPYMNASIHTITSERNFFGVWRVTSSKGEEFRRLWHGSTVHGIQFTDPARKCEATSYYSKDGPIGQVFDVYNAGSHTKTVAAVGLGAAGVATYSKQDQHWDFYEIDPAIVRIDSNPDYFSFLTECSAATHRVLLGDARLKLRDAAPSQYGLMIMDAFSSDSVPAHLLTTEAMELYLSKLGSDGLIAFHISNRYLDLEPLLSGLAKRFALRAMIRKDEEHQIIGRYPSIWVVLAKDEKALGSLLNDNRWRPVRGDVLWTDDFSNILSLLK